MPQLHFYAVDEDWEAVLEAVFELGSFRVFEAYSEPDRQLLEFHTARDVLDCPRGWMLRLYAEGSGPAPVHRRIDLHPGALGDATFRWTVDGWGLIELHYGGTRDQALHFSTARHLTEKSAAARTDRSLGNPAAWDWPAVTRASNRLNRRIRGMADGKIASRPVLPHALRHIDQAGLRYEHGLGVHAKPSFGATPFVISR